MFGKILVGVDGSECSTDALKAAGRLAEEQHAALVICYVVNPMQPYETPAFAPDFVETYHTELRKQGEDIVRRAAAQIPANVSIDKRVVEGNAIEEIVGLAGALSCDLIVLGSHGRSGLTRLMLGSVAEGVARLAQTPVLIVRSPQP